MRRKMISGICVLMMVMVGVGMSLGAGVGEMGLVGDGKADDTAGLQKMIDSGMGNIVLSKGVYRITKTLVVDLNKVGVTSICSDGTARIVMAGSGAAIKFVGTHGGTAAPHTVKDVVWEKERSPSVVGVEIVGGHAEADGIEAVGTMKLMLSRVVVRKARHGIRLVERNRNVIITGCHLYENEGVGIYLDEVNLHQINIVGSHVSYNKGGGIVVRGGNVRNIHIGTCDIEGNMGGEGSAATANVLIDARGGSVAEVAIVGCTIQHTRGGPGSANIRFIGESVASRITEERRHGHLTIGDNVMSDVQYNIDIERARGVTITGNTMWAAFERDVRVRGSKNVVVGNNMFERNPRYGGEDTGNARPGALFEAVDGVTVVGNHFQGMGGSSAGIEVNSGKRMHIANNTILDARAGIVLKDVSGSKVSGNMVRDDREGGKGSLSLRWVGGKENMVSGNYLWNGYEVNAEQTYVGENVGRKRGE